MTTKKKNGFDKEMFAARLRGLMAEQRVTREALAEMTGISPDAVGKYARGVFTPGADKLCKLAEALGTTPNHLMGWGE